MLKWAEEGSESKQFTLIQSKRKREKKAILDGKSRQVFPISKSSRTTPYVYRKAGDQENPVTLVKSKSNI
jgi:hypothetical protein